MALRPGIPTGALGERTADALPRPGKIKHTDTKVESGTSQSKSRTSLNLGDSGFPFLFYSSQYHKFDFPEFTASPEAYHARVLEGVNSFKSANIGALLF